MPHHRLIILLYVFSLLLPGYAAARSLPKATKQTSVFVSFLNRYVNVPAEWTTKSTKKELKEKVVFTKEGGITIEIQKFPHTDCDVNKLTDRMQKAWKDAGKEVQGKVDIAIIPGVQAKGWKWMEPNGDSTTQYWCVIPRGRALTALAKVSSSQTDAVTIVEKTILPQLYQADRKR